MVDLPDPIAERLRDGKTREVALGVDHSGYRERSVLDEEVVGQLRADLHWQ